MVRYALLVFTGADALWHRFGPATGTATNGFSALGPTPELGANDRIVRLRPLSVAGADCSLYLGERVGDALDGTAGLIQIPNDNEFKQLQGSTLTLGNLTITFRHTAGAASSGTIVNTYGKTRAQVVAEVVLLLTAVATGIGDLEVADGEEEGAIVLQSDASSVVQATWAVPEGRAMPVFAEGLARANVIPLAVGTYTQVHEIDLRNCDVRAVSLLGNGSTAKFLAEIQSQALGGIR